MARARNIKPGFFSNDQLAECQPLCRLLFAGLWTIADREGRLLDRPNKIKAEVLPYDKANVEKMLAELQDRGFIIRYKTADGMACIQILAFAKHQNPHKNEAKSTIPAPEKHSASTVQAPAKNGTTRADSLFIDSLSTDSGLPDSSQKPERGSPTGSRLPPDWVLPPGWKAWAMDMEGWSEDHTLDVADQFRDYWAAKAGKDARKVDWEGTWRNWVRRQKDFAAKPNGKPLQTAAVSSCCAKCSKPITGPWTSTSEGRVHDACWQH